MSVWPDNLGRRTGSVLARIHSETGNGTSLR
ncbi:unnamed protein product [Cylicostephanus goldi]|uniref:Uncharacterized protein n=1 Tax=Cylicostephanus goldi TaxID=71465 RepID=A0A3P6T7G8_CYLGO|nr:unnamed protein product [Cylicostephanus goldi]